MATEDVRIVAKFYTIARKFPKLIGRIQSWRIPGGPYTMTQLGVLVVVFILAMATRGVWGGFPLTDFIISVIVGGTCAWAIGQLPSQRRSLPRLIGGALHAINSPAMGRHRGVTFRLKPPHGTRGRVAVGQPRVVPPLETLAPPAAEPAVAPAPTQPRTPVAVTGVERLLQQTRGK